MSFFRGFKKEAISHETAKSALNKAWERLSAACREAPALTEKYIRQYARFHKRVHNARKTGAQKAVEAKLK